MSMAKLEQDYVEDIELVGGILDGLRYRMYAEVQHVEQVVFGRIHRWKREEARTREGFTRFRYKGVRYA